MASLKEKGAWVQWRAERFGGLGHGGMRDGVTYARDICNLRPLEDGTLCSRDGYAPIAVFDGAVRGAFCHESGGERWLYAVSGRRIYTMLCGSKLSRTLLKHLRYCGKQTKTSKLFLANLTR